MIQTRIWAGTAINPTIAQAPRACRRYSPKASLRIAPARGGAPAEERGPSMPGPYQAAPLTPGYSPYERPITSSMISSVPAPIRFRRMSRQTRSTPYSFM